MLSFNFGSSCKFFILASSPSFLYLPTSVGHTRLQLHIGHSLSGSSPHMWGIPDQQADARRGFRFIPTHVGHTIPSAGAYHRPPVHPHIRGAYMRGQTLYCRPVGSSPHTWGILQDEVISVGGVRFIPTYVGHTPPLPPMPPSLSGSSPHTWGILLLFIQTGGNRAVHPHIRGAYGVAERVQPTQSGSSPHTWGILPENRIRAFAIAVHPHIRGAYAVGRICVDHSSRFIPTYVGHTRSLR